MGPVEDFNISSNNLFIHIKFKNSEEHYLKIEKITELRFKEKDTNVTVYIGDTAANNTEYDFCTIKDRDKFIRTITAAL